MGVVEWYISAGVFIFTHAYNRSRRSKWECCGPAEVLGIEGVTSIWGVLHHTGKGHLGKQERRSIGLVCSQAHHAFLAANSSSFCFICFATSIRILSANHSGISLTAAPASSCPI